MNPELEFIPKEHNSSIYAFKYSNKYFESPWHYHNEYELTYIIKSSGIRYVGNSINNFNPGELVLLGKSLPHCWKNAKGYTKGAVSIVVQWKEEVLGNFFRNTSEFHLIDAMFSKANYGIRFKDNGLVKGIKKQLFALLDLSPSNKLISFIDILNKLASTDRIDILSGMDGKLYVSSGTDTRIKDILSHIDEHYQDKIGLQDVADLIFMNKVSFCKYFKKHFDKTFTNFLNEYRIEKACQLLHETDHKLSDIAYDCGYNNMAFFHRQFQKITGVSPAGYRKMFKNIPM